MARPRKQKPLRAEQAPLETTATPAQKRAAVKALWQDTFDLCVLQVQNAKAGKVDLKSSLLKEINAFLRLSMDVIDREQDELMEEERQKEAEMSYEDLPDFGDDEPRAQAPGDPQLAGFDMELPSFDN